MCFLHNLITEGADIHINSHANRSVAMETYVGAVIFPCSMRKKLLNLLRCRTYSIVNMLSDLPPALRTSVFILGSWINEYCNQVFWLQTNIYTIRSLYSVKTNKIELWKEPAEAGPNGAVRLL